MLATIIGKKLKKTVKKFKGDDGNLGGVDLSAAKMLAIASKSGYLQKEGGSVKTWKKRLFVLVETTLMYFKDENVRRRQRT